MPVLPNHQLKTIHTQTNHFMLSILAYVKLEFLQLRNSLNHFAMKSKIYLSAMEAAMWKVKELSTPLSQKCNFL